MNSGKTIVFYDAECALCNEVVVSLLKMDKRDVLSFCSLQSQLAQENLSEYGVIIQLDTMMVLSGERIYQKSDSTLCLLRALYPKFKWFTNTLTLVPRNLRDTLYDLIARNRHRIVKREKCHLMKPEWKEKFIG